MSERGRQGPVLREHSVGCGVGCDIRAVGPNVGMAVSLQYLLSLTSLCPQRASHHMVKWARSKGCHTCAPFPTSDRGTPTPLHCRALLEKLMPPVKTGMHSEKCVVRRFHLRAHMRECTYPHPDGAAYCTPRRRGRAYCS